MSRFSLYVLNYLRFKIFAAEAVGKVEELDKWHTHTHTQVQNITTVRQTQCTNVNYSKFTPIK